MTANLIMQTVDQTEGHPVIEWMAAGHNVILPENQAIG